MVRGLAWSMVLLSAGLLWGESPPGDVPSAKSVLLPAGELPGGAYRYPWDMGPNGAIKTEAEWHERNRPPHIGVIGSAQAIRGMSDEDWSEMVAQLKKVAAAGVMPPPGAGPRFQNIMVEAVLKDSARERVAEALEQSVTGLVDSAVMQYIRVQDPAALQAPLQPGQVPKAGSVIKLNVGIEIWSPAAMGNRVDELDFSPEEVTLLVQRSREVFEKIARLVAGKACASLEEDLVTANQATPLNQARVDDILARLNEVATVRIDVTGRPLGLADNGHLLLMRSARTRSQPQAAQGAARIRRGRAELTIAFEVADIFADDFEKTLIECLDAFVPRLAPFDL